MMVKISEKDFESTIESYLLASGPDADPSFAVKESSTGGVFQFGGYHKRTSKDYDKRLCLIPDDVISFLQATQPKEWIKIKKQYQDEAREHFLARLSREIKRRGTLDIFRKGVKDSGAKFQLYYHQPSSALNPEVQQHYQANIFSVVRQLHYSEKDPNKSLDLGIFLNGIPIFTAELKDPLTGQNVLNAIAQYQKKRDPREPLFAFGRCLSHFAIDPNLVYFSTHLEGEKTIFLPFNQGYNRGAGNPPYRRGFATAYFWEQVWARDSILNLIQDFIHIVEEDEENEKGEKSKKKKMIFPRYHQLDAVRRLIADAREKGSGHRYLIQHSAGSGKSYSISWLAHQLSKLHDKEDERVFDSIIVITDRRVLDRQLQTHVRNFEQTRGLVENIDKTSKQLKKALQEGKNIIVTTLQKFPVIADEIDELEGQRFAVIIDEAHSSQTGESVKSLKKVLAAGSLEEAEIEESKPGEDLEDKIIAAMQTRGQSPYVSYFAFTATPKSKTLELFGTKRPDGKFEAFSLYTMRQAIEEKFILDVLEHYTTYKTYWELLKTIEDDPLYDRKKANYLLKAFVDLHEHTIDKKVTLMVEHYNDHVFHLIGGRAKAMIVTRSRLHAVRYKLAVDRYIKEKGYPFQTLVAFSGKVNDPDSGESYTETSMNTASAGVRIPEKATAETFKDDRYRIMIVAEKFQMGFDQPLLHTMYVDKKLHGLHAVQTLSRLNRIHPPLKESVMVLDFGNDADDIEAAFLPYYDKTQLEKATDPNLLYDLENRLREFNFYSEEEIDQFARVYFGIKGTQDQLISVLSPVVEYFESADKEEQVRFKSLLRDYVRLYAFLSQVITFTDASLEKLYNFGRILLKLLPIEKDRLPVEITEAIDLESLRIQQTSSGAIELPRGGDDLKPQPEPGEPIPTKEEQEALSKIIAELNERFGTEFSDEDTVPVIERLEESLNTSLALQNSMRVNTIDNARLTFNEVVDDLLQAMIDTHFKFYKSINDDEELGKRLRDMLFARYQDRMTFQGV